MTKRTLMILLLSVVALTTWSGAALGQTTGRIRGRVVDQDGAPLPGVTVTVSSESLMGGSRTAVSGETGAFRFANLPPAAYNLVAAMDGFQDQTIEAMRVNINATALANFSLVPTFSDVVVVSGESPLVDVTSSATGTSYESTFIKELPTNRNFYDMLSVSPGVATSSEGSDRQIAFGSNMQSNAWHIDGLEASAPETGTAWIYTNPDTIEEIQVLGVGAGAQFGNMLGAAFNVVTKSGSNNLKGTSNVYFQTDGLTDSKEILPDNEYPTWVRNEFWDVTAALGGPIKRDKLWFFAAYEYNRNNIASPGLDPDFVRTEYSDIYDLKLSTQISQSNRLDVRGQYNTWGFPEAYPNYTPSATPKGENGYNSMWALNYSGVLSDRAFLEVKYSGWKTEDEYLSLTGSTEPGFIDYSPPGGGVEQYSGGLIYPWLYETGTQQVDASASYFADELLGEHDFKFGVRYGDGSSEAKGALAGKYYYRYAFDYEYYGTTYSYEYFYKVEYTPYYYGNEQTAISAYVDDSWKVGDRLTLNLGLRYDRHQASVPDFPRLDIDGNPTGEVIPGVDPVFTWNNVSPRLGFAYNAGAKYSTVIRGSAGVYYDGNVGGNWNTPPPNPPVWVYSVSTSPDGPFEPFSTFHAGSNNVDPNLEAPRTTQYSLGFEHQFLDHYSVGVQGVYKDTDNLIGFETLDDGVWEEVPFTDPFTGREYMILNMIEQPTVRKGNQPGFTADPRIDRYYQDYWGVLLTFNRRFSDWWSLRASYTLSESTGLIPRMFSQTQFNPPYGSREEGADPNNFINAYVQNLQGDRRHMFRVQAAFDLPYKLQAGTAINLQSGRPYSRQINIFGMDQGRVRAIMDPASDDLRHPFQSIVDFTIGRRFKLPKDGVFKLDVQFFNLLNNTASDTFQTLVLQEGDTFVPDYWVLPRRIMLRVGVEY